MLLLQSKRWFSNDDFFLILFENINSPLLNNKLSHFIDPVSLATLKSDSACLTTWGKLQDLNLWFKNNYQWEISKAKNIA